MKQFRPGALGYWSASGGAEGYSGTRAPGRAITRALIEEGPIRVATACLLTFRGFRNGPGCTGQSSRYGRPQAVRQHRRIDQGPFGTKRPQGAEPEASC